MFEIPLDSGIGEPLCETQARRPRSTNGSNMLLEIAQTAPVAHSTSGPDRMMWRARLMEIVANLRDRIAEAGLNAWLGEVEGLTVSLQAATTKLADLDRSIHRGQPGNLTSWDAPSSSVDDDPARGSVPCRTERRTLGRIIGRC
jgi:hypothetical protein